MIKLREKNLQRDIRRVKKSIEEKDAERVLPYGLVTSRQSESAGVELEPKCSVMYL